MASGRSDIHKDGEATQFPHNDPTKGGRKPSIKKQLVELLETEGVIIIPQAQVISVNEDGSVSLKLPTEMHIAMKLQTWAMSKQGNNSLNAIKMIMEQIDGKPKNTHEVQGNMNITWVEEKTYETN